MLNGLCYPCGTASVWELLKYFRPTIIFFCVVFVVLLFMMCGHLRGLRLPFYSTLFRTAEFIQRHLLYYNPIFTRVVAPKAKILVSMIQLHVGVVSAFSIVFPKNFVELINTVDVWDTVQVPPTDCVFPIGYYRRFWYQAVCLPLFAVTTVWTVLSVTSDHHVHGAILNAAFQLVFLYYPALSETIFDAFDCESFDDNSRYLRADLSMDCDSEKYLNMRSWAFITSFVILLGVPFTYLDRVHWYWQQLSAVQRIEVALDKGHVVDTKAVPAPAVKPEQVNRRAELLEVEQHAQVQAGLFEALRDTLWELRNRSCEGQSAANGFQGRQQTGVVIDAFLQAADGAVERIVRGVAFEQEAQPLKARLRALFEATDLEIVLELEVIVDLQLALLQRRLSSVADAASLKPNVEGALHNIEKKLTRSTQRSQHTFVRRLSNDGAIPAPTRRQQAHAKLQQWHRYFGLELEETSPNHRCIVTITVTGKLLPYCNSSIPSAHQVLPKTTATKLSRTHIVLGAF